MDEHDNNTLPDSVVKELVSGYFKPAGRAQHAAACPGEEILADYIEHRLDTSSLQELELHLCHCDTCLETVIAGAALREKETREIDTPVPLGAIKTLLSRISAEDTQPLTALWQRGKETVTSLVNSLMEIIFFKETEAVYVRGSKHIISKNLVVIEKTFKEIKLEIEVEKVGEKAANIKVKTASPGTGARVDGVRINLFSGTREIASFITAGGQALFENIRFGEYTINVQQGEQKLGHLILAVKES
jgi:hypothetical protein